jgi:hypothetical protein
MKQLLLFGLLLVVGSCRPEEPAASFRAGASMRDITPDLGERYSDLNANHRWEEDEPFEDADGDGVFEPLWLANDGRRPALAVRDPLAATAIVIEAGGVRVGFVGLDSFGHSRTELERIRQDPGFRSTEIDLLLMGSSHTHEGPDVVGMYGLAPAASGADSLYLARVREAILLALQESIARLRPAVLESGSLRTGLDTYQVDQRDPMVIDDRLGAFRVRDAAHGRVIATLVNWASHPEIDIDGSLVSADFVGAWRRAQQVVHPESVPVFFQGALGGQIGSNRISFSHAGITYPSCGACPYEKADALGAILSGLTEHALSQTSAETPDLIEHRTQELRLRVDNVGFRHLLGAGLLERALEDEHGRPIGATDPSVPAFLRSEMVYLRVGSVAMLTIPGELHPELAVGGYDGSHTPGGATRLWSADHADIGDLSEAPGPPYLRDLLDAPVSLILAVTQDFLGYIIPPFHFRLHPERPYLDSPDWNHHYEETNALGPSTADSILHAARALTAEPR